MGDFRGNSRGFGDRDSRPRFDSRGGRDSGRGRFGGGGGFRGGRDRNRGPVEMHDVICDKCKKECQVPFKPSTDKPVLCSDCFKEKGGSRGGAGSSKKDLDQINAKLDKIIKVLQELEMAPEEDEKVKKVKKEKPTEKPAKEEVVEEAEDSE